MVAGNKESRDTLTKSKRVEQAYSYLKHEILQNRLGPGFQALEPEIAATLKMSRTPVREALLRLENDGLVALVPRRGMRVLPISPTDMQDIYQLLSLIEPEIAAEIAHRGITEYEVALLGQATTDMETSLELNDLDAWARADDRFHRELVALSRNRRMVALVQSMFDQAHRVRVATLRLRVRPSQSTQDHRAIVGAIVAGDADLARELFGQHRQRASDELLKVLRDMRLVHL